MMGRVGRGKRKGGGNEDGGGDGVGGRNHDGGGDEDERIFPLILFFFSFSKEELR